ncbi:hypothetical protein D3C81_1943710 [compost metagenome]
MQTRQGDRVAQQGKTSTQVQTFGPDLDRFGKALGAHRLDRCCLAMTGSGHGTGQGVLPWVDHSADEAVVQGMPAVLVGVLVGGEQLLGRCVLLRDQEQLLVLGRQAQACTAGDHRYRD